MAKKPIKAKRCVHMSDDKSKVIIFTSKHGSEYQAGFTIGVQDFTVATRGTKEEADWFCGCIESAFLNLLEFSDSNFKIINKNGKAKNKKSA